MYKKFLTISLLLFVSVYLYSQNDYAQFLMGNTQVIALNLIPVQSLEIRDGQYFATISNGYEEKQVAVKLTSPINSGSVSVDYKLGKNEFFVTK